MVPNSTVMVLEQSRVAPSGNATELSVPLTLFDMILVNYAQVPRLLFFDFPHPKHHFVQKIIPNLKTSLSLALQHFLPFAGNLLYPMNDSGMPVLRYVVGDSVSVMFAECSDDFNYLKGNHARDNARFYPLIPQMPPTKIAFDSKLLPILAVQVTVFPNFGIVIGTTFHHVVGDASTANHFWRLWASICYRTSQYSVQLVKRTEESLPTFDHRDTIKDAIGLGKMIWNEMKKGKQLVSSPLMIPKDEFRATFIITGINIQKLKHSLLSKRPNVVHPSSFSVICAFIWTCFVKSGVAIGEAVNGDEPEYFFFAAECRGRLDPPLPANYSGNCCVPLTVRCLHQELIGNDGILIAAELIGNVIHKCLSNKKEMLKSFESWLSGRQAVNPRRGLGISGSPKFDSYDVDFGWGKPEKYENIRIRGQLMSLEKSRKSEGGVEVCLVLPKVRMDAFSAIIYDSLGSLAPVFSKI